MAARLSGRAARAAGVAALASTLAACYHPEPLDARALLAELRRAEQPGAPPARGGPPAPGGALTLDEDRAVALALVYNRPLRAFRLERGVAEAEIVAAGALANPVVRLELTHLQSRDLGQLGWGVGLAWDPPQPVVRGARIAAAEAHRDEVGHEIAEREWTVASDARAAWAELATVDEELRLAEEAVAMRKKLRGLIEALLDGGGATRFDLDLAALSEVEAERLQLDKARERHQAEAKLLSVLGIAPRARVKVPAVATALPAAGAPASCAGLEERALSERPALAAAAARHRSAEEVLRQQLAARWPWIRLSAMPRVRRNEIFGQNTDVLLGLDLTVPVLDWNRGPIRAAETSRDRARAEWVATLDGVRREIASACAERADQIELLHLHNARMEPLLQEHDALMSHALGARQVDLTALVLTEERVLADRLLLARARLGLALANIALDRAVGTRLSH